jgi:asparagine synthetase B (glutamine-hydrolysing)
MLFVAITRSSVVERLSEPHHSVCEFVISPEWFLTCVTDDFISRLYVAEGEIAASESLIAGSNEREGDVAFLTVRFSRAYHTLKITKHSVSGRPVYFSSTPSGEFFLSTHMVWLRRSGVVLEEDTAALPELLIYRNIAPPRTLFRGIRQLQLAGNIAVQVNGRNLTVNEAPVGYSPTGLGNTDDIASLLNETVARLTPVALRVATLLSGGVDSSILGVIARDQLSVFDTFSTTYPFDDPATNSEQEYALSAASALSTRHTLFTPTAGDFLRGFIEAVATAEVPLDHLQSVLLHLLFKDGMPDRLDRIICGEGADSTFGLETLFMLHHPPDWRHRICSIPPFYAAMTALGTRWDKARSLVESISKFKNSRRPISDPLNPIWTYGAYGDLAWVQNHYGASRLDVMGFKSAALQLAPRRSSEDSFSTYALNFDVCTTCSVWSKLAEGQRKILYFPFTNQRVLDAAFSIPWETKLKTEKHIVREVGRRLGVPEMILNRPKKSFGIASDRWAVKGGPLEPLVQMAAKVVDIKQLRDLQGTEPRRAMLLWSLLNYAMLKRLFVAGESKQALLEELSDNCHKLHGVQGVNEPVLQSVT